MWTLGLRCDGCGEDLGCDETPHRDPYSMKWVASLLKRYAEEAGWERVKAPDEETWFCPTCRRARSGEGLEKREPRGTIILTKE